MNSLWIILAFLATHFCFIRGQTACLTPKGVDGTCKLIDQCPSLLSIYDNINATTQDSELLNNSLCELEGGFTKVCCSDCYTPHGNLGKCISIYTCPHILRLVKYQMTEVDIQYLKDYRCESREKYSVCCDPPRDEVQVGNCPTRVSAFPPDPQTECCGMDAGGSDLLISYETSLDQYPWLTLIEYIKEEHVQLQCSGALISGRYLVTAAHCVVGDILKFGTPENVRLGEYNIQHEGMDCKELGGGGLDCSEGTTVIPIEQIIPHPEYTTSAKSQTVKNDIALIRLAQNAPYTDFIRPICLPSADVTPKLPEHENTYLTVAGWGSAYGTISDVKLHISIPYVRNDICEGRYKLSGFKNMKLTTSQLCAGDAPRRGCKGDEGGPLMYENGRHYELIGVQSFGSMPCNRPNTSDVYTKVYEYNNWIRRNIVA